MGGVPHCPQKPPTQDAPENQEMRHPDAGVLEKQAEDRSISSCFTKALPNPLAHSWKLLARGETYSITFSVDTKWTETEEMWTCPRENTSTGLEPAPAQEGPPLKASPIQGRLASC